RYAGYLRADGVAIVNRRRIVPVTVSAGNAKYPEDVEERLKTRFGRLILVDGGHLARETGNVRTENVVLLGTLSRFLEIPLRAWEGAIARLVPKRALEANLRAFSLGRKQVR
ncbi:MAG: indolepyruvate oxidoreductase subunit beta, partial [Candidatus Latescibacterota bacterium]